MSQTPASEEHARRARAFGRVAPQYERGRPTYPAEAIEWLLGGEPLDLVDLGAGTGKLTRVLIDAGHRVRAVEPLREMRVLLADSAAEAELIEGTAERIPLPAGSADAVLVGAAFHWFDQERALAEIARVLRPPGVLGLLGNGFDTSVGWMESLRERLGSRVPGGLAKPLAGPGAAPADLRVGRATGIPPRTVDRPGRSARPRRLAQSRCADGPRRS